MNDWQNTFILEAPFLNWKEVFRRWLFCFSYLKIIPFYWLSFWFVSKISLFNFSPRIDCLLSILFHIKNRIERNSSKKCINTTLRFLSLCWYQELFYTASQKHESTLLHAYVLNEFLIAERLCTTKYFWKMDQFWRKRCPKKRKDVSYQLL